MSTVQILAKFGLIPKSLINGKSELAIYKKMEIYMSKMGEHLYEIRIAQTKTNDLLKELSEAENGKAKRKD